MRVLTEQAELSSYTTLRLGGTARRFTEAGTAGQLIDAARAADSAAQPLLVLGGGSNLVIADAGFPGTVIRVATSGVRVGRNGDSVTVTAAAGENWARLVDRAVTERFAGIECLAGIPGLAGATPIQNVGAYGQDVAAAISAVSVFDRLTGAERTLGPAECRFGYRTSVFKAEAGPGGALAPTGRYIVLDVTFQLVRSQLSAPVRYQELASRLGVSVGERAPLTEVRDAVIGLRRDKGMVLDPADPDTVSAGSFFTNPVITADQLAGLEQRMQGRGRRVNVPAFAAGDSRVKVPAAWLIEQAGFGKGYQGPGVARVSSKHSLALCNPGGATTADLIALARQIVAGVADNFGITLTCEPVLVGIEL